MGAWGTGSYDCDSVMDNCDPFRSSKLMDEKATNKILKGVKTTSYDPTEFHGTVLFMVERGHKVSRANLEKAQAEVLAALGNADYLRTWNNPKEREEKLREEFKTIHNAILDLPAPKQPKAKALKHGKSIKFRFNLSLGDMIGCSGIDGLNNLLDDAWHNKQGYDFTLVDVSYKIVAHKGQSMTLEADATLVALED